MIPIRPNLNIESLIKFSKQILITSKCWVWTGTKDRQGYGSFSVFSKQSKAHRYSYGLFVGDIENGMCVLHSCDNPSCVNPDHLRTGTRKDNSKDCIDRGRHANANKTHCKKGHEYSFQNTVIYLKPSGITYRCCRWCVKIRNDNRKIERIEESGREFPVFEK